MLEKTVEIAILFDYYGNLLTEKQRKIMDLRYVEDLSLAEIAEQLSVSRQAVHDAIHRTVLQLYDYEDKLGLVKSGNERKERIGKLEQHLRAQGCFSETVKDLIMGLRE